MTPRGGTREKAGRPKGTGRYGSPTKAVRLPEHLIDDIYKYVEHQGYQLPLYSSRVKAGFPSPADDHLDTKLDLNQYLIKHPAATFFVRVSGNSMINAGIFDNDLLIVDRSLEPASGKIIIAAINGELTVKRLQKTTTGTFLVAENPEFAPIRLEHQDVVIWGVVTNVIHAV